MSLPIEASSVVTGCLEKLQGGAVQSTQRSVLLDERVECFLWQPPEGHNEGHNSSATYTDQTYFAFEINYAGKALTNRAQFGGKMGFDWTSEGAYASWTKEMPVGWGASASPVPSAVPGASPPFKRVVIAAFTWSALGISVDREIRIGLHRAEHPLPKPVGRVDQLEVDRLLSGMVWSSWVDPGDAEVNFHRPASFGQLVLAAEGADIDCSCCAARLLSTRNLAVIASPQPSLAECPPGSLLVRAKFASLCGSDLPYFRDSESKAPSCYWDRDGFCGHEAIGIVVASKSDKFKVGDPVMSLPSSYFKAHVGSKQEWYREEVHGVLTENFPVRGGFSQIYTSHELYTYRIKECVPRLLAAQGLGTVLRMAKKVGSVIGKHLVIVGQGQNGLIATRLFSQLCAKSVTAVEPLEYRRKLALAAGATGAVTPEEAAAAIANTTGGRGADLVLEMVGHNQKTINQCLTYVACSGIVAAFGVPDDKVYQSFEYTEFFRKNVNMMASVIPDPGVDFPDAVELIDQGRFSTEGLFSHVLPLAEVQKAFTMASDYTDGVVKLVIDLE